MKRGTLILALLLCAFVSLAQRTRVVKPGSGGANLYNTSDTLTSDRLVNLNGKKLVFKTDSLDAVQSGVELRPGMYSESLVAHYPLIIAASPNGEIADSIWFGTSDTNLSVFTNTNGIKYGQANTFTNPRHIIDKAYCDANVSGATGAGKGGIYEGDGYLPENIRASGGSSQRSISFDSIGSFEIKDWNTGQALRVWQHINSAAGKGFGRLITASATDDSLDISHTDGLVFDITATKPIHFYTSELKYFGTSFNLDFGSSGQIADLRGTKTGLQYAADYSASFVARSLVDKAYVDNATAGAGSFVLLELGNTVSNPNIAETTFTKIDLTEQVNTGSSWSYNATTDIATYTSSTSRTVKADFTTSFATNNTFDHLIFVLRKNGAETRCKATVESTGTGQEAVACGTCTFSVTQNDQIQFGAYFESGGSANVQITGLNLVIHSLN